MSLSPKWAELLLQIFISNLIIFFSLAGYSAVTTAGPPLGGAKRRTPLGVMSWHRSGTTPSSILLTGYSAVTTAGPPLGGARAGRPWRHVLAPKWCHSFFVYQDFVFD